MNSRRMISLLIGTVLTASMLIGCGQSAAGTATQDNTETTQETSAEASAENTVAAATDEDDPSVMTEIVVWSDNAHEKELREKQIAEFNDTVGKEEGIHISYTVYGTNFKDTLKIAAQADEAPDLYRSDPDFMHDFANAGYLVALEDMPGGVEMIDRYRQYLINELHVFNGKTYTLPYNITSMKFVVNKDLFDAAGLEIPTDWTWDDVRSCAKTITENGKGDSFGFGLALNSLWTVPFCLYGPQGVNAGNSGYDYDTHQFNYEGFEPMVSAIYGMAKDGSIFPGFEGLDADAMRAQFSEGKIGIVPAASFDTAVFNTQFPAKCEWVVVPEPKFAEGEYPYKEFVQTSQLLCIGTTALKHPVKTMKVMEFFYDDANAAEMYENGLYIPIRDEALALATKEPEEKGFVDFTNLPQKFTQPQTPQIEDVLEGDSAAQTMANIWAGTAGDDIPAILKDLDDRYNAALATLSEDEIALYNLTEGVTPVRE